MDEATKIAEEFMHKGGYIDDNSGEIMFTARKDDLVELINKLIE